MKRLLIPFVAIFATACGVFSPNAHVTYDYNEATARNIEPEYAVFTTPIVADLDITPKRITHIEKDAFADIVVDAYTLRKENIEGYKKIALARAAKAHNADVLIGSMIEIRTIDSSLVITVTGFPAKYVNFRNATREDTQLMRDAMLFRNNNNDDIIVSPTDAERILLKN